MRPTTTDSLQLLLRAATPVNAAYPSKRTVCFKCLRIAKPRISPTARGNVRFPLRHHEQRLTGCVALSSRRTLATVNDVSAPISGPIPEYDNRVKRGTLRNDEHQRAIIQNLQDLHEMLRDYRPPKVIHPTIEELQPKKQFFLSSLFQRTPSTQLTLAIPSNLPKGLYMYGDVGSGKTMLMDLFFDTLPSNIISKNRVHFHNFMQDVHKRLHKFHLKHGSDVDAIPFIAADIAEQSSALCFDEFQCTDVADAMILRRLMESLMHHGTVVVTTSNRHPDDLYKNGVQRESFIPCINLLKSRLRVINLDSTTDYRKIPRPPSGVYHHPLDKSATSHVDKWFQFLGDFERDPPHPASHTVWGRKITVPAASGPCAKFPFDHLIGAATSASDYLELVRNYEAFIITDVPAMSYRERDWARRFITFIDAVYESRAKLVLTTAMPLTQLFMSRAELEEAIAASKSDVTPSSPAKKKLLETEHDDIDDSMRMLMDDLGMSMTTLKSSSIFSGDEERFAFARALSRLSEMGSKEWVERGMGLVHKGGKEERDGWQRVRSKLREDSM